VTDFEYKGSKHSPNLICH